MFPLLIRSADSPEKNKQETFIHNDPSIDHYLHKNILQILLYVWNVW